MHTFVIGGLLILCQTSWAKPIEHLIGKVRCESTKKCFLITNFGSRSARFLTLKTSASQTNISFEGWQNSEIEVIGRVDQNIVYVDGFKTSRSVNFLIPGYLP